ncbi:MAG: hypothetical protein ACT4O4_02435 [Nitrospiraceae bacterium]
MTRFSNPLACLAPQSLIYTAATGNSLSDLTVESGTAQGQAIGDVGRSLASIGPGVASAFNFYAEYSLYKPVINKYLSGGSAGHGVDPLFDAKNTLSRSFGFTVR